jgi:3-hydroxypropanoate dehydrogenase
MTDVSECPALGTLDTTGRALLFTEARTANAFAETPVSDEELAAIWELARWAPTSANTQPLRVLYIRPGEGRARLVKHMAEGNQAKTAAAPAVAVLAADTRFHEHIPTVFPLRPQMQDVFEEQEEARLKHSDFNATLQAGYFILAVRAQGLAAGPMTGFDAAVDLLAERGVLLGEPYTRQLRRIRRVRSEDSWASGVRGPKSGPRS